MSFLNFLKVKRNNTISSQMQTDPDREKIKLDEMHKKLVQSRLHHKKQLEKVYKTTENLYKWKKESLKARRML